MKTANDIITLKNQTTQLFGNGYSFLINRFANYYISKSDGKHRIVNELKEWDEEARQIIINDLKTNLSEQGITLDLNK